MLDPTGSRSDVEVVGQRFKRQPRVKYQAMRTRMEVSAHAIACGASYKMAAQYAGCSERQIKKYMEDADYRARIEELRVVLAGKIKGKILREFNRRVTGKQIRNMETMDLSRIFDRVTAGGKGMNLNIGEVNIGNHYEQILAALFDPNGNDDGEDFPQYGDPSITISGTSTPVDSEVPRLQRGETDREEQARGA